MQFSGLGLVALPYEQTTSFIKGTVGGPAAILRELSTMDTFDFLLGRDPLANMDRAVVTPHDDQMVDPEKEQAVAKAAVTNLLEKNRFVISLGGEHTVSLGPMAAMKAKFGDIGVVQLDAHGDMRHSYEGSIYSHACVMRRLLDQGIPTLGVGIRAICTEEHQLIKEKKLLRVHAADAMDTKHYFALLNQLPEKIYLTVDLDFFDPEVVPGVGTPEPGGPSWDDAVDFITYLFAQKNVIGADVVELLPRADDPQSVRLAARLVALIAGLAIPPA